MKKALLVLGILILVLVAYVAYSFFQFARVSQGSPIGAYNNAKKALLIIDVQRDMTEKDGLSPVNLSQTDPMIDHVNTLLDRVTAAGFDVIYIRHEFKDDLIVKLFTGGALAIDSAGAQIDPRVKMVSDKVFVKNIMDSFSNPQLDEYLRSRQIDHLYVTGMDAEACVDRTVKAALNRGYKVTVVQDAIATSSDEGRRAKLHDFKQLGADLISTAELAKEMDR